MAGNFLLPLLSLLLVSSTIVVSGRASVVGPVTELHRSAATDLLVLKDGLFGSLEETYEALKTIKILEVSGSFDLSVVEKSACPLVEETLKFPSLELKDIFFALKVNDILECKVDSTIIKDAGLKLQSVVKDANLLLDLYYSIGALILVKKQGYDVVLAEADKIFHSVKILSQSDGRWRYDSNIADSSTQAAGLALETLAGVISLAASEIDQSMVGVVKHDIAKLFDNTKSYDDGSLYFDEEQVDITKYQGPLSTTASIIRGITAFADVSPGKITVPGEKILGLANFLLSIGIPGTPKDLFHQIDSLSCLENNRVGIPLILSLPSSVISLSSKDLLKVKVTTVLGSVAPSLTLILKQASRSDSTVVLKNQELKFDQETSIHLLDIAPKMDVGKYTLSFEVLLHNPEHTKTYITGNRVLPSIYITGFIKIDDAKIAVFDTDVGSTDSRKLNFAHESSLSLSANHLHKLLLSFKLSTPLGGAFKPHQVFLKLIHETGVNHIFLLENSGKEFKSVLDFLGLVDKLYYLSGNYELQLTVGDALMENSFIRALGHLELDLPDAPEKATRPPLQAVDPYSRFGPKTEISHIFRAPEKLPPKEVSLGFTVLTILPLLGFIIGLACLGINFKNFPSSSIAVIFSILFHAGIAAVLALYALFWLKLDLFTTLKILGVLGIFLVFVGHGLLSHLASMSVKLKSS